MLNIYLKKGNFFCQELYLTSQNIFFYNWVGITQQYGIAAAWHDPLHFLFFGIPYCVWPKPPTRDKKRPM